VLVWPEMKRPLRLSWCGGGLACAAAVLNGMEPLWPPARWVFVGVIAASLVCVGTGLWLMESYWQQLNEAAELEERWRQQRRRATPSGPVGPDREQSFPRRDGYTPEYDRTRPPYRWL
jgi:hypothetical protein